MGKHSRVDPPGACYYADSAGNLSSSMKLFKLIGAVAKPTSTGRSQIHLCYYCPRPIGIQGESRKKLAARFSSDITSMCSACPPPYSDRNWSNEAIWVFENTIDLELRCQINEKFLPVSSDCKVFAVRNSGAGHHKNCDSVQNDWNGAPSLLIAAMIAARQHRGGWWCRPATCPAAVVDGTSLRSSWAEIRSHDPYYDPFYSIYM